MSSAVSPKSPANSVRVPNIAVIGVEGAGKTVLATTLAKRLGKIDSKGIFLNPQDPQTLKYVEKIWATLQAGDWPPTTLPGELFELRWKLHIVGEMGCDVRLVDVAGQDLRHLFGEEKIHAPGQLPGRLQELAEYCRAADIILYLINLRDFVGHRNPELRAANEAAIKAAIDYGASNGKLRRVCLVLTQADQYEEFADKKGGWRKLAAEAFPYVFSAHMKLRKLSAYPVAAVAETHVKVDGNGTPRRVPRPGFRTAGLDQLANWLTRQIREFSQENGAVEVEEFYDSPPAIPSRVPKKDTGQNSSTSVADAPSDPLKRLLPYLIFPVGCVMLLITVFLRDDGPRPVIEAAYQDDPGVFDDGVIVYGKIRNDGDTGRVRVTAWVVENNEEVERQRRVFVLQRGESADFQFQMNKLISVWNPHAAFATAEALK